MKKVLLIIGILCLSFLIACKQDDKKDDDIPIDDVKTYKNQYVLDMDNYEDIFKLEVIETKDEEHTIGLKYISEDYILKDFEVEFSFKGISGLGTVTYTGKINDQSEDMQTVVKVSIIHRFEDLKVTNVNGVIHTDVTRTDYREIDWNSDEKLGKLRNELIEKLATYQSNQIGLNLSMNVSANNQRTNLIYDIAVDIEENYMHTIINNVSGIIIHEENNQLVLNTYMNDGKNEYIAFAGKENISSIIDYEDYEDITFKIDESFYIKKDDDNYILEAKLEDLFKAANQGETLEDLSEYRGKKLIIDLIFLESSFIIQSSFEIEQVKMDFTFNYTFGEIDKINLNEAIKTGSLVPYDIPTLTIDDEITNHVIPTGTESYYKFKLEAGNYAIDVIDDKGEHIQFELYLEPNGYRVHMEDLKGYLVKNYHENAGYLKEDEYIMMLMNYSFDNRYYDIVITSLDDLETPFNADEPDFIEPNGVIEMNFEHRVDQVGVKFADKTQKIRIKHLFEENLYVMAYRNGSKINLEGGLVDIQTYEYLIYSDTLLIFIYGKEGTIKVDIEITATSVDEPVDLLSNDETYYLADGEKVYYIDLNKASVITLKKAYKEYYYNALVVYIESEQANIFNQVSFTIHDNTEESIYLPKGKHYITFYAGLPVRLELTNLKQDDIYENYDYVIETYDSLNSIPSEQPTLTLTSNKINSINFSLTEDSMLYMGLSTSSPLKVFKDGEKEININIYNMMMFEKGNYQIIFYQETKTIEATVLIYKITDPVVLDEDHLNDLNHMKEIAIGETVSFKNEYLSDREVFKFTVTKDTNVRVNLTGNVSVIIYHTKYSHIYSAQSSFNFEFMEGTYYIRITYRSQEINSSGSISIINN